MLNLKKVIALVCTLALVITSVSVVSFAEAYTDVTESSAYYEAVESLSKLGIVTGYEDGTYKPEETVTRAEMAALIARIQGYEETAKANANTVFTDVPSTYWASGYVAQANGQGIINGYGDGTFGPDDAVKYEEAVKMIMATLGYTPYAMNNGGYPTGYLAAAQFYGVTKGVSNAVTGTGANRGTIAQLLANAIDTPIMGQSKWSTDGSVEYTIYDGKDNNSYKTLMSENLDVVKLKGVIKESSVANLKGTKEINNDEAAKIKVAVTGNYDTNNKDFQFDSDGDYTGEDTFLVAESDAEDYLGMAVILYVRENDDNEYEVISIAADGTKNDIVTFTLDQFDVVEESTSGSTTTTYIKYFKNSTDSSSIKKQLASNYDITLNGASKDIDDIFGAGMVVEPNGKSMKGGLVTLIDNDGKTGYDVVMVEVAATAVVDEIGDETISFKEQAKLPDGDITSLDVEEDATDTVIDIVKDGKAIAYTDLKEWDVLSIVAPNADNKGYIKVEVISNPVTGQITSDKSSKTSATNKAYKIDGKFYDVAEGSYKTKGLSVNDAGIFYIDKYGKIAAFSEDSSVATGVAGTYGYVYDTLVTDNNMDNEVQVKMITANGAELMKFASTVNVNLANEKKDTFKTSSIKKADVDANDFAAEGAKIKVTDLKKKVVKYTKNSSNNIKTITLADYNDSFVTGATYPDGSMETYDADNYRLGKYIDKDSKVFFISSTDSDKCSIGTPADLSDNNKYKVLAFYADDKTDDNNIVVIEGNTNTSSKSTSLAVITSAATGKDENDSEIVTLSYIVDGTEVKDVDTIDDVDIVTDDDDVAAKELTAGDIVRIKTNSAGKISGITVLWKMDEDVRNDAIGATYVEQKTAGDAADTRDGEVLYGGAVTAAKDADKVYFGNVDWDKKDSNGKVIALADQVEDWVNIGKAKNVYTVQTIRDGRVQVKKGGSFNYVKQMFDNTGDYNFVYDGTKTTDAVNKANLAKYVDHVFVREYDGRIEDVVIVKAPKRVSAR